MNKFMVSFVSIVVAVLFTACGESASSFSTAINHPPKAIESNISVEVNEGNTTFINLLDNVTDSDSDTLTIKSVMLLNGQVLPTGYSYSDNNLTIDTTNITFNKVNQIYDLNVSVSDGNASISYIINSTLKFKDATILATNIIANSNITTGSDLNVSIMATDGNGIDSITYDIYKGTDVTLLLSLLSGQLIDKFKDNNYTTTIKTETLGEGNYILKVQATGYIAGVLENSTITKDHNFTISHADASTSISSPTLESITDTTINTTIGIFNDDDGERNITVKLYMDSTLSSASVEQLNGDFTNLLPSKTYYIVTSGEAFNGTTQTWQIKKSNPLIVTTKSTPPNLSSFQPQLIHDMNGSEATYLPAPSGSNILPNAIYSIVVKPTEPFLTVNSSTGIITWYGNIDENTSYDVNLTVTNPDSSADTISFAIFVIDN